MVELFTKRSSRLRIPALMLVLLLIISATGCQDDRSEQRTYKNNYSNSSLNPTEDSKKQEFLAKYPDALQAREVKYNPLQCLGKNFVLSGRAELDDYYNYDYRGLESVYFCIHVTPEGGSYADSWYIYADRSSKSELYEQLMNGTISDITLICKGIYPDSLKEEMANLTDYYIG